MDRISSRKELRQDDLKCPEYFDPGFLRGYIYKHNCAEWVTTAKYDDLCRFCCTFCLSVCLSHKHTHTHTYYQEVEYPRTAPTTETSHQHQFQPRAGFACIKLQSGDDATW